MSAVGNTVFTTARPTESQGGRMATEAGTGNCSYSNISDNMLDLLSL